MSDPGAGGERRRCVREASHELDEFGIGTACAETFAHAGDKVGGGPGY